jgi:hypothetical protein
VNDGVRLVTFQVPTPVGMLERLGAVDAAGAITDLNAAFGADLEADGESEPARLAAVVLPPDMLRFLEMGGTGLDAAHRAIDWVASATAAGEPPEGPRGEPVPDADVRWPRYTELLDYELELACVIGRRGRDLSAGDAARYRVVRPGA